MACISGMTVILVEIIDPKTGEPVSDGERGELVVTPLVKEAMPLLRYRTGDVTMLMEDGCLCRRGQKIARITGRSDDMLVIRGINVFPSQIEHVLLKIPEVGNQFMVYIDRINHLDEMTVEVEINRDLLQRGTGRPCTTPEKSSQRTPRCAGTENHRQTC